MVQIDYYNVISYFNFLTFHRHGPEQYFLYRLMIVLIKMSLFPPTEIRVSPTKPSGKGSKRKQDELDEDEEDEESQTWVEALNQQYSEDEGPEEDPDFEVRA